MAAPQPLRALLLLGVGALSVAAGLLIVRYAFIGLMRQLPGPWNAIVSGGAIGLLVTGVQAIRQARRGGASVGLAALVAAATLPLAAVLGVYALVDPRPGIDPARAPLQAVALPGLELSLPAWDVREAGDAWQFGAHLRDEPGGRGRFVEVRWTLGESLSTDEYMQIVRGVAGGDFVETAREQTLLAVGRADTVVLEQPAEGKRVARTTFRCPDDPRSFHVVSFLSLEREALIGFHRRLLATARCVRVAAAPAPVLPRFTPPPGFERSESPTAAIYVGPQREVYTLSIGVPGRELLGPLQAGPALAQQALSAEFELVGLELASAPAIDGARVTWTGRARDEGGAPLRTAMSAWHCPGPDLTFVGFYAGPESIAEADALRVLQSAACP